MVKRLNVWSFLCNFTPRKRNIHFIKEIKEYFQPRKIIIHSVWETQTGDSRFSLRALDLLYSPSNTRTHNSPRKSARC
uniref:Uncharacterized protein n=1 Tax=Anguilla anguilla TaxID=7936 RepID=A0A0E9QQM5_ANGAN